MDKIKGKIFHKLMTRKQFENLKEVSSIEECEIIQI